MSSSKKVRKQVPMAAQARPPASISPLARAPLAGGDRAPFCARSIPRPSPLKLKPHSCSAMPTPWNPIAGPFGRPLPKLQLSSAARASLRQQQPHALAASSQPSRAAIGIVDVEVTRQRSSGMPAASPEPLHSSRLFSLHRARPRRRFT